MTKNLAKTATHKGGCHWGDVRFRVTIDKHEAIECNCSICTKKGFVHLIVPAEGFTLLKGKDSLSTYQFNTGVAKHIFCKNCGIHSFYRPRSHPDGVSVNLRCLDEDLLSQFKIIPFNGKSWEDNVDKIRK